MLWGVMRWGPLDWPHPKSCWHYIFCYPYGSPKKLFFSEHYEEAEDYAEHMTRRFPGVEYHAVPFEATTAEGLEDNSHYPVPAHILTDEESWQNETKA